MAEETKELLKWIKILKYLLRFQVSEGGTQKRKAILARI
jgi:hypothetical protein